MNSTQGILCGTALLALAGCAAAPAEHSILERSVDEIISGTAAFSCSDQSCPRGTVALAEYHSGSSRVHGEPDSFSCVPEGMMQGFGYRGPLSLGYYR